MANILENRVLTGVVQKLEPQDLVGINEIVSDTIPNPSNIVEWDEITLSRDLATFSAPDAESNRVDPEAVTQRQARTASIREKKALKPSTLAWLREPGTRDMQRAESAIRRELQDLRLRVDRRVEWMVWEALHNSITYSTDEYKINVTYNIPSENQQDPTQLSNGSALWDDDTSSTPIEDLVEMQEIVEQNSASSPDVVYMPRKVMRAIIDNDQVNELVGDGRMQEMIARDGRITTLAGLDLRVYDATYTADDGTTDRFVGENDIVMLDSSRDIVSMLEAPALDPKANFDPGFFSKSWEEEDPATTNILVEYQSLPIVRLPESVYVTNVL